MRIYYKLNRRAGRRRKQEKEKVGIKNMKCITVKELYRNTESYLDKEITVAGWLRSNRGSKAFGFLVMGDGSCFQTLQIVYHDNMENFKEVSKLNVGAAVIVKGTLVATPEAKQPFEIQAEEVVVEGDSAPDYPLQKKRHSFEYLRTIPHLRARTNTFQAVFRVRSLIAYAIHQFFQERGFVYVHTPLITGSDCEGAGEDVPGYNPGSEQRSEKRRRYCGLFPGLLLQTYQPDCKRTVKRRNLCDGV